MDDTTRARLAELAEAEFALSLVRAAPGDVRDELGMSDARVGSGVAVGMRHDPTGGFWNRSLGFGVVDPFTGNELAAVLGFYDEVTPPAAVVQVSPLARPDGWEHLLEGAGLVRGASWVKFLTPIGEALVPDVPSLTVRQIDSAQTKDYADAYMQGYGIPAEAEAFRRWLQCLPTASDWLCFGAWDRDELIAAANLFVAGDVAVLGGAGTIPSRRGRGAQLALMAARVRAARQAGCRWVSTETGSETPEDPNPSLHNMRRLGLHELYERRNWVYRPAG